ncbi:MAG: DEAD/DEAH box helicase [Methanobacteriaceae archaeon]|jgi:DNA helicase-2/ATP-dependent DNA helicase PcrA|uniref:UvrD-helicase domain-containing protein n=1 Tax=Methanobrevibacter TaxID=2172 RepID=UPI00375A7DC3|nr:DEAD/DEAH box helicase [Methanobacteriaceae archaeon]MDD4593992.1 DEAD/DEAH box helicase [Methanobacteriaceae archaeon]
MITYSQFKNIVVEDLSRDINSNIEQNKAISSNLNDSLFLVAGPGSGKTTVIVLKILKYIFVDDVKPEEILATTFTKKAANELSSRILSWGQTIKDVIINKMLIADDDILRKLVRLDLNQILTGTLDSIAEELMRIHRDPGTKQPVVIEDFITRSVMLNVGLFKNERYKNKDLQKYLASLLGRDVLTNPSKMSEILLSIKDRLYYDLIDWDKIQHDVNSEGSKVALNCIRNYVNELENRNMLDFVMLEYRFLKRLKNNKLNIFLNNVKILLVDEYQDTNLLQEKIYFKIGNHAIKNNGNITVVGDDDQSLYRFRGATVDLFTDYKKRAAKSLNTEIIEINLKNNYRSSKDIVNLCNDFVELDSHYQEARVKEKPQIKFAREDMKNIPVLGMFRNNGEQLAADLSKLIKNLVEGKEVELPVKRVLTSKNSERISSDDADIALNSRKLSMDLAKDKESIKLQLDPKNGSPSDIALLTYSPKEKNSNGYLFPYYLKKRLEKLKNPIEVYNPRGQDLQGIPCVKIFCGLMLECIDPAGKVQKSIHKIPTIANHNMRQWRKAALEYVDQSPEPNKPISLNDFLTHWQARIPFKLDNWPDRASLIDLAYKLITWVPDLQDDVEGLVYLEAITKTITQTGFFNEYNAHIIFDAKGEIESKSINEAIWNIFIPISMGGVSIDESLLYTLPENRLNIMSIHQSKGLEFPLVIVDVGSRFNKNQASTSQFRFPKKQPKNESLEDKIRSFSTIGESKRNVVDRNFDDLTRLYFVAFSRAEDVLILIGLYPNIDGYMTKSTHKTIPNVALGWSRDEEYIGFNEIYLI